METEERKQIYDEIKQKIKKIINGEETKRGIYLYGLSGTGKTYFIKQLLEKENYEMIYYDSIDVRNKLFVNSIFSNDISKSNILQMLMGVIKKTVIVIDNIDELNFCDKKTMTLLVKNMKQKKTKKKEHNKKLEEKKNYIPIICIGNYCIDKKIKELMKFCFNFQIKSLNDFDMLNFIKKEIICIKDLHKKDLDNYLNYIQGDLRKFYFIKKTIENEGVQFANELISDLLSSKTQYNSVKDITKYIFNNDISIKQHSKIINDNDKTTVSLLWHENVVDLIDKNEKGVKLYLKILDNICFADYIYRIIFQYQIWQFNDMSSIIKLVYNNYILRLENTNISNKKLKDIRFTKIITKYSTEYNNFQFILKICQILKMDAKDIISLFENLKEKYKLELEKKNNNVFEKIESEINNLDIIKNNYLQNELPKLQKDINRMIRFLEDSKKNISDTDSNIDIYEINENSMYDYKLMKKFDENMYNNMVDDDNDY